MEMVMRFSDTSDDVEVLTKCDNGAIEEKLISIKDCAKEFIKVASVEYDVMEINNIDGNVLFYSRNKSSEFYTIRMYERKIKCTYKGKGYSIIHPDSIFKISIDLKTKNYTNIQAFCIKEYKGKNTELFRYPFPNMLSSNAICTGTISKDASDPVNAILNVIEGNYTHDHTSNDKVKNTVSFFQSIKKTFDYSILAKLGMTLESLVKNNTGGQFNG